MIRIARNISRNLSRNLSRTVGTEPDLVLDSYSGASAAYSLYDLGNRRGTVVETEATYHNPAVRLRRDSDNTHKSFPGGAFTQMLNWANEDVVRISPTLNNGGFESWSAGKPSAPWNTSISGTSTITQETTGVYAGSSCVRGNIVESGSAGWIRIFDGLNGFNIGCRGRMSFYARVGSGDSVRIRNIRYSDGHAGVTVTETGWTYFEFEWEQTSDTSVGPILEGLSGGETIWIDNLTFTQLTSDAYATTWYDQSGVQVVSTPYESDFSAGVDGWIGNDGASDGNIDGIGGKDDNLRFTVNTATGTHTTSYNSVLTSGASYEIKFDVYIPSSNTQIDGVRTSNLGGAFIQLFTPVKDSWVSITVSDTATGSAFFIGALVGTSNNFTGNGTDVFYIRNVKVEQLNKLHNDATQATADSQPKVVDAGVLVTDANGNYPLDFDGVDDYLDVATISESQPITGFVVVDAESAVGDTSQDILDGTVTDTNRILLDKSGSAWRVFAGASLPGPTLTADVDLLYFLANGASSAIGLDGATPTTGDAGTNSGWASGLTIGTSISGAFLDGYLSAIIIYPTDQSANRSGIESVLSNTITTALS